MTPPSSSGRQHALDRTDHAIELGLFGGKLPPAGGRERVEARATVVLRGPPLGLDAAIQQEPLERWIQCALPDPQHVIGRQPQVLDDAVTVFGTARERLQDEELERAGQEIGGRIRESHQRLMGIYKSRWRPSTPINT